MIKVTGIVLLDVEKEKQFNALKTDLTFTTLNELEVFRIDFATKMTQKYHTQVEIYFIYKNI